VIQQVGGLDAFCMKRLRILKFLKNSRLKIKKSKKTIPVDVFFKAFPMILRLIQSGRTVPLKKQTGACSAATTQYCIHSFREIKEQILQYYILYKLPATDMTMEQKVLVLKSEGL
jgi:hypothetical protein